MKKNASLARPATAAPAFPAKRAVAPVGAAFTLFLAVACGSGAPDVALPLDASPDAAVDGALGDSSQASPGDSASLVEAGFDAASAACHVESVGPMPPDAGDVTYSYAAGSAPACFSSPLCQIGCSAAVSLVEGLLACTPAQGGYFWLFGSSYIRVHGIAAGSCVYDIGLAVEGGYKAVRCSTSLPVKPWAGLDFYAAVGGGPGMGDMSSGLSNCETVTLCETDGCGPPDASPIDGGGLPADAPQCPGGGTPPDWC